MTYNPLTIAKKILEVSSQNNHKITPMKLLKLVYITHGWYLAFKSEPLIDEQVEAWQYGPVIPTLYHQFKNYGATPIDSEFCLKYLLADTQNITDKFVLKLIEQVWKVYGKFTALQLSNITHRENTPWYTTWHDSNHEMGITIPEGSIEDHYKRLLEERTTNGEN